MNVYPFIEAEKWCRRNVKRACELLKVSRAAFYAYLSGPSGRDQDDTDLAAKIAAVHEESKGRYGAPRVHAELRRRGHRHGRKRVARLMRQAGIAGLAAERWKKTTIADPAAAARADRIRRDFTADASKLDSPTCKPGPPGPAPAGPSSSTSPGTTALACTAAPWATSAPPNTKPPPETRTSGK